MIAANPDLPGQMRMLMILVPSIIAFIAALKFCSALAVYWTASNCFSAIQTAAVHFVIGRRIQAGRLQIQRSCKSGRRSWVLTANGFGGQALLHAVVSFLDFSGRQEGALCSHYFRIITVATDIPSHFNKTEADHVASEDEWP